jgi:hypothetical protein
MALTQNQVAKFESKLVKLHEKAAAAFDEFVDFAGDLLQELDDVVNADKEAE